jgi:glycosyltransferase involved in cell wall biosynthesis
MNMTAPRATLPAFIPHLVAPSGLDGIAVVICTRNRASQLPGALAALSEAIAAASSLPIEVVVVDNGSNDGTGDVIDAWLPRLGPAARKIVELRPGLAAARNAGVRASHHSIIAMTDDDCHPARDWLGVLAQRFAADAMPSIRGGRVDLGDPRDLKVTIRTGDLPECYDPAKNINGFAIGANLAFHRAVFDRLGGFDERFGAGARYRAAEETDFIFRGAAAGIPLFYDPGLRVLHFHGRRSHSELGQLMRGYCFSEGAFVAKHFLSSRRARSMYVDWLKTLIKERLGLYQPDWIPEGAPGLPAMFLQVNKGMAAFWWRR